MDKKEMWSAAFHRRSNQAPAAEPPPDNADDIWSVVAERRARRESAPAPPPDNADDTPTTSISRLQPAAHTGRRFASALRGRRIRALSGPLASARSLTRRLASRPRALVTATALAVGVAVAAGAVIAIAVGASHGPAGAGRGTGVNVSPAEGGGDPNANPAAPPGAGPVKAASGPAAANGAPGPAQGAGHGAGAAPPKTSTSPGSEGAPTAQNPSPANPQDPPATAPGTSPSSATSPSAGAEVTGQVSCDSGASVVGVWVAADTGPGSGYASLLAVDSGTETDWWFNLVPMGPYSLHVGCGGSASSWGIAVYSPTVQGGHNSFDCNDVPGSTGYKDCVLR